MLTDLLLPWLSWLDLDDILADENRIMFHLTARQIAACPRCSRPSEAVHSRYQRRLADLPCAGMAVGLRLQVRKLFCRYQDCEQIIFCERLPQLAAPYARRTARLHNEQRQIGFDLGGEAGMRAARRQAMPVSAATLLRFVRNAPLDERPTPRDLGRGRLVAAQRTGVRHDPGRPGATPTGRSAVGPFGRHPGTLAAGTSRRGDHQPRPRQRLCRGCNPRRTRCHPGCRPLSSAPESARNGRTSAGTPSGCSARRHCDCWHC